MNKQIQAEGGEIILRNSKGDIAIIPAKYRLEAMDMVREGCHGCLDKLIETLPKYADKAEDGSVYGDPPKMQYQWSSGYNETLPTNLNTPTYDANKAHQDKLAEQKRQEELYRQQVAAQEVERIAALLNQSQGQVYNQNNEAKIQYGQTDLRRSDVINPNNRWMYPQLSDEGNRSMGDFSLGVVGAALPIPGIDRMGRIPSMFSRGNKFTPKSVGLDKIDDVVNPMVSSVDNIVTQVPKQPWQAQELPGLHLKSTMTNNPKGLHTIIAKDGTIDTKFAMERIKGIEGDAKYEVVLKNMQNKYGSNLENMPKRMDYNTLRKDIQDDLWDIGTGKGKKVDRYAGMDMKKFGIIKKDKGISLGYEANEVNLTGYSFTNKNKFIGGSDAHNMPKETLGHSRGFTNPKEPGIYYSAERQSNWAQEAGSTLKKTDIELLQRQQQKLSIYIKEQDDLIKAGNDTWAIGQKERFQSQLKEVNAKIDSYNRYATASPQEKLVMKNMNERMLQEDVAYAASKGHTKYRMPSEETMAKIQGFSKKEYLLDDIKGQIEITGISKKSNPFIENAYYNKEDAIQSLETHIKNVKKDGKGNWDFYSLNDYENDLKILKTLETKPSTYLPKQQTILKHTSQSLKDAEKLFDVKLKPITDSKGNTWYEFDIPKAFKEGKGEIKALGLIPPAAVVGATQLNKE